MARGRGGKHQHRGNNKRKRRDNRVDALSKKQKTHLQQFGEIHPSEEGNSGIERYKKIVDREVVEAATSSSDDSGDDEAPSAFQQLVSSLNPKALDVEITSDAGDEDSEDEIDIEPDEDKSDEEVEGEEDDDSNASDVDDDASDKSDASDEEDNLLKLPDEPSDESSASEEEEEDEEDSLDKESDPFVMHFEKDDLQELCNKNTWKKEDFKLANIGPSKLVHLENGPKDFPNCKEKMMRKLHVKKKLCDSLEQKEPFTAFQRSMFSVINNYQDLLYTGRTFDNGEELRTLYCEHALNHALKTRSRVISHNAKIKSKKDDIPDEYRDQGLTRPKVLIVVPFREAARRVVNIMTSLLAAGNDKANVLNKKRFQKEYSLQAEEIKTGKKPEDYNLLFDGNIDDCFRLGMGVSKKSLKLYTTFYASDVIVASPVGLRTLIEDDHGEVGDHDFLSSIEVLIIDQMDVLFMQNWDHVLFLMKHLHLQPKESHGVDFSRVRMWTLDGLSRHYRQTVMLSSVAFPEMTSVFSKQCTNWAGKVLVSPAPQVGTVCQIVVTLPQVFQRIKVSSPAEAPEERFQYFKTKILPQYKDKLMSHTLIFVPSYFDFVRLRNYMKKEDISSVNICEYSKEEYKNRGRSAFFHGLKQFMLYTERMHFNSRYKIKGVKNIIFYELPFYAHFYSELCNLLAGSSLTCTVIYSRYDAARLAAVVGSSRAARMVAAEKDVHMLVTGDDAS